MYACVHVYGYMHISAGALGVQKRVSVPLELKLQAAVNHVGAGN